MEVEGGDVATVFANDAVADAEAEPWAFAGFAGGVEGVEDAAGLAEAGAGVADEELNGLRAMGQGDADGVVSGRLGCDGLRGVVEEVLHYLAKAVGVAAYRWEIVGGLHDEMDAAGSERLFAGGGDLADQGGHGYGYVTVDGGAPEVEEAFDGFTHALGFTPYGLGVLLNLSLVRCVGDELCESHDGGEWIIKGVGYAAGEEAESGELFGTHESLGECGVFERSPELDGKGF
jgi:hypothetical protein